MTTSGIRFSKNFTFLNDSDIRKLIKSLINQNLTKNDLHYADAAWMLSIFEKLIDDHENAPPGLRDIELDEILTDDNKIKLFKDLLHETAIMAQKSCDIDNQSLPAIIEKINLVLTR